MQAACFEFDDEQFPSAPEGPVACFLGEIVTLCRGEAWRITGGRFLHAGRLGRGHPYARRVSQGGGGGGSQNGRLHSGLQLVVGGELRLDGIDQQDRKSTRLNSSH